VDEDRIYSCLHQLLGYWPTPAPTQDETLVLTAHLARYTRQEFEMAFDMLFNQQRQFRPAPAEVAQALRSAHYRVLEALPSLPPGPPAAPEASRSFLGQARERLIGAMPWASKGHAAILRARWERAQLAIGSDESHARDSEDGSEDDDRG
jgi:hypothetical protein